jgi:dephospho-CoA kinase
MKVIGIVGLPASGKGEFSAVARRMGIPVVVMGDVIRAAVEREGLPPTDKNMGDVAGRIRQKEGMDAIARLTIPFIESESSPLVVVDGIRGDAEVNAFRHHFTTFTLVGISSDFETRVKRLTNRGRSDDSISHQDLRARDERELGWGLGRALLQADITLCNEGSLERFSRSVQHLLTELTEE